MIFSTVSFQVSKTPLSPLPSAYRYGPIGRRDNPSGSHVDSCRQALIGRLECRHDRVSRIRRYSPLGALSGWSSYHRFVIPPVRFRGSEAKGSRYGSVTCLEALLVAICHGGGSVLELPQNTHWKGYQMTPCGSMSGWYTPCITPLPHDLVFDRQRSSPAHR